MILFDLLFILCLSAVILSFCGSNFGMTFLSDHLRCALDYDTKVKLKVNDDPENDAASSSDSDGPSARIAGVIGNSLHKTRAAPEPDSPPATDSDLDDDLSQVLRQVAGQMSDDVEEPPGMETAFKDTVATILSNEMLRKAFFQDVRSAKLVTALRNVFEDGLPPPSDIAKKT